MFIDGQLDFTRISIRAGTTLSLKDAFGRAINYMRLSITDRCNFRCVYCMPRKGVVSVPHNEILTFEEMLRIGRVSAALGISRFKVTGGEPLCRKGCASFMRQLKRLPGVEQVTLTTNISLLARELDELADVGLDGLNASLDTLSQKRFATLTRSRARLSTLISALHRARALGIPVKINVVPMKGFNDGDFVDIARFALESGFHIRFIELMPVGRARKYAGISQESIFQTMCKEFGQLAALDRAIGNGPAANYAVPGFDKSVGFISALSHKFCRDCNRVRLTSSGFLKTCLHHNTGTELKPFLRDGDNGDEQLAAVIAAAVRAKPGEHDFGNTAGRFLMSSVGG
ncbi:MAG: GTP 3',8-cyclase MoaA [Desulfovibrio sp.]|jgi:cyclic pyranopterin phosphate synthase|nr:GTP 3',8-cyclase MoaA [Desulfovibrio sp.]